MLHTASMGKAIGKNWKPGARARLWHWDVSVETTHFLLCWEASLARLCAIRDDPGGTSEGPQLFSFFFLWSNATVPRNEEEGGVRVFFGCNREDDPLLCAESFHSCLLSCISKRPVVAQPLLFDPSLTHMLDRSLTSLYYLLISCSVNSAIDIYIYIYIYYIYIHKYIAAYRHKTRCIADATRGIVSVGEECVKNQMLFLFLFFFKFFFVSGPWTERTVCWAVFRFFVALRAGYPYTSLSSVAENWG